MTRQQVDKLFRGLQQAADLANRSYKAGDQVRALQVWGRATHVLREGFWDHLLNTRPGQQAPLWSHMPAPKAAALVKQVEAALRKMYDAANMIDGFDYKKIEAAIHDFYRALSDVLDAQEEHKAPQMAFKGVEREQLRIEGTPVILEYQADKRDVADQARKHLGEVIHSLNGAAQKAGLGRGFLPPLFVTYTSHPSPKYLVLSLFELARGTPKELTYKLARRLGEKIYDSASASARMNWSIFMQDYGPRFTIRDPRGSLELEDPTPRDAFAAAVAGAILRGPGFLDDGVLDLVHLVARASHA